jgi:tetratricopeptide (TPR) repeat protein
VDNVNDTERPGDPALLALATVDQAFPGDSEADREALRSALEAAAVPHWCNAAVLTALVDDSGLLGPSRWDRLNGDWQQELGQAWIQLGDVAQERGDLDAAERAFARDLAICEQLARQDPGNIRRQRELAIACEWVGDLAQEREDLDAAEDAVGRSLAIPERLTRLEPANAGWRRELAEGRRRTGG